MSRSTEGADMTIGTAILGLLIATLGGLMGFAAWLTEGLTHPGDEL